MEISATYLVTVAGLFPKPQANVIDEKFTAVQVDSRELGYRVIPYEARA